MTNDIGSLIPHNSDTVNAIYAWHKKKGDAETPRRYLGASIIGHECERYLWYVFRFCCREEFDGRMYRLFETGDLEEIRFCTELRGIGCEVHEVNDKGNQFGISALSGHLRGHMDGVALGIPEATKTWHVLEFKTHDAKSYAKLVKDGVEKTKPLHFAQMQIYMGVSRMTRALYLARNKDTDELYSKRVRVDNNVVKSIAEKAKRIITSSKPPERIAQRSDDFRCRLCSAKSICWKMCDKAFCVPFKSCRQCCHATPVMDDSDDGKWFCEYHKVELPFKEAQLIGCPDHLPIPDLISGDNPCPVDGGDNFIMIESNGINVPIGSKWDNFIVFTTEELMKISPETLFSKQCIEAKTDLNAKVSYEVNEKKEEDPPF